ncbi:hypothetical protein HK100_011121 [Physocladia obscura]|uniref:EF-hand domain-containing protein n=1 Tax=Physocladia obscura TaxID=109957 RepID=A0AAD5T1M4_9FUNG|nr:hypothetical protein HK100_011121 [Physocladia obscura]
MADQLTLQQIREFQAAFTQFDSDSDGRLTTDELVKVLNLFGQPAPTKQDLAPLFAKADRNSNGTIELNEFLEFVARRLKNIDAESEFTRAFRLYDENGDGFIVSSELKHVMTRMGNTMSDEEIDQWIKDADVNKDGKISLVEFLQVLQATNTN